MKIAFSTVQQQFGSQLQEIICKKVGHNDHCHDILQEVYLKIWINLPKIEAAANIAGYLVKLTNNTVIDHYRKTQPVKEPGSFIEGGDHHEDDKDRSLQLADCCLRPMIESLPAVYRDALVMTELQGMKQQEFADQTGISLSNAKMRVQRAKKKLKEVILQCCAYQFDHYGNIISRKKNHPSACCPK